MNELLWCPECEEWREDASHIFCTPSCEDCGSELEEKVHPTRVEVDYKNVDSFVNHDDATDNHAEAGGDADYDEDETEQMETEDIDDDQNSEGEAEGEAE